VVIKVLLISHTCQSATEGQPKAELLGRIPGVALRVLVPDRWRHYGHWRGPARPAAASYEYTVGRVGMPWVGPAQFYLHWYPGLASLMRDFRPNVIDLWEEPWGLVSAHACWLRNCILPGAKIVSETEQNIDKRLPPPFEWFRSYTLKRADYAVGRSAEAVGVLRAHGFHRPAEVVPNGVDAELFRPMDRESCRRALSASGFVVGYVGRLVEEKGLADLVDALPLCPGSVNLLFVGSGPMQRALEEQAGRIGVADRVRFLPACPLSELPQVMNSLDLLALPSRTTARWKEQFGRVIIEAHACGVPAIGSDSGAIPSVIGAAGLVFRERNPQDLARAIGELLDDPRRARQMGAIGRVQVESRYAWERVAAQMHSIYCRVLEGAAERESEENPRVGRQYAVGSGP
jgi:glycosyltransferase involved in cell wall biosynthesis